MQYLTARDIAEWEAFAQLEPFGDLETEYRFGMLAAVTAEPNRNPKKVSEQFKPWHFFSRTKPAALIEQEQAQIEEEGEEDPALLEELNLKMHTMMVQAGREPDGTEPTS